MSRLSHFCRGQSHGGRGNCSGRNGGGSSVSVEDLVWRIRRLPAREPISTVAASALPNLDSRACAALLKELARTGLAHRAQDFFDYVLSLGEVHEAARLCDVYTYTAAISICVSAQQVCIHNHHLSPMALLSPAHPSFTGSLCSVVGGFKFGVLMAGQCCCAAGEGPRAVIRHAAEGSAA